MIATPATIEASAAPGQHYLLIPKSPAENLAFRRRMIEAGDADPGVARALWWMCREDILFYVNTFCWTFSPKDYADSPHRPFNTWDVQDGVFTAVSGAIGKHDIACPKSREMGLTWCCLTAIEHRWHFWDGQTFLICSRKEELVDKRGSPKSLFWKIDYLHKFQPKWLLPSNRSLGDADPNRTRSHLENADNGSVIDGEATVPDLGRGDRLTAIFLDEAAFMDNARAIARATRDATLCRILNSTPNGTGGIGNEFYRSCHNPQWKVKRVHWSQHPEKCRGAYRWGEGEIELLDPDFKYPEGFPFIRDGKLRSPWYDLQCARANSEREISEELDVDFWGSGEQFFKGAMIESYRQENAMPPYYRGMYRQAVIKGKLGEEIKKGPWRWWESAKGQFKIWGTLHPATSIPFGDEFAAGCDIAAGTGGDFSSNSCLKVIDKRTGRVVASYATNTMDPKEFAELAIEVCKWFNNAVLSWENDGPTGIQFGNEVIRIGYRNLYYSDVENLAYKKKTRKPGWCNRREGKASLLGEIQRAMRQGELRESDEDTLDELLQFVWKDAKVVHDGSLATEDESGKGKAHGDRGIALGVAWEACKDSPPMAAEQNKEQEAEPGTIGFFIQQDDEMTRQEQGRSVDNLVRF